MIEFLLFITVAFVVAVVFSHIEHKKEMEQKRKRPVEFIDQNLKTVRGIFHQFGIDHKLGQNVITVAIIEDDNGHVHKVDPGRIKFLDK